MDAGIPLPVTVFLQSGLAVIFARNFVPKSAPLGLATKPLNLLVRVVACTLVTTTAVTFLPHLLTVSYSSG